MLTAARTGMLSKLTIISSNSSSSLRMKAYCLCSLNTHPARLAYVKSKNTPSRIVLHKFNSLE